MEQKELYTFEELCEGLEITMSAFSKRAEVDEGTIARIRKGYAARSSTVNKLLRNFSEVYGLKLTRDNVLPWAKSLPSVDPEKIPVSTIPVRTSQIESPLLPSTNAKKRMYTKRADSNLPDGCISTTEFAKQHGITREAIRWHMDNGLGPGLIGMSTDTMPERDRIIYSQRVKRVRKDGTEYERYFTPEQQNEAVAFWKRHDVSFADCERPDCPCH